MAKFVLNLILIVLLNLPFSEQYLKECDTLGIHFYELLGCKITKSHNGCPIMYNCPKYKLASGGTCMVGGKTINRGERIKGTTSCLMCHCEDMWDINGSYQFPCAMPGCVLPPKLKDDCYLKQDFGYCCAAEEYCPDQSTETCLIDGKNYTEFQIVRSKDTCLDCVCKKGFQLHEEPFCRRIPCNLEVTQFKYLANNCTPYYSKSEILCCPTGYICNDDVKSISNKIIASPTPDANCVFNGEVYPRKSKFDVTFSYKNRDYSAKCECKVGPHPTCIVE